MRKYFILSTLAALTILLSFPATGAPQYKSMFLRGTFNGWVGEDAVAGNKPYPMKRVGPNKFEVVAQVSKGRHKYKFEVTGGLTWGKNWGCPRGARKIRKVTTDGKLNKGRAKVDTAFNDCKTKFLKGGKYKFTFNANTEIFTIQSQ